MNRRSKFRLFIIIVSLAGMTASRADDASAKKTSPADPPAVRTLSFAPDGSLLAAGVISKEKGVVLIWDVATRKLVARSESGGESAVATFSRDGKAVVVANGLKSLVVLNPLTGKKTDEFGPFPSEVTGLLSAGAGKWITLGKDGALRV